MAVLIDLDAPSAQTDGLARGQTKSLPARSPNRRHRAETTNPHN
jgi:hypothetical protein